MNPRLATMLAFAGALGSTALAGMPQGHPPPTGPNRLYAKRVARLRRVATGQAVDPDGLRDLRGAGWVTLHGCPPRATLTAKGYAVLDGRGGQ